MQCMPYPTLSAGCCARSGAPAGRRAEPGGERVRRPRVSAGAHPKLPRHAPLAELAYAWDLSSHAERLAGSSPAGGGWKAEASILCRSAGGCVMASI